RSARAQKTTEMMSLAIQKFTPTSIERDCASLVVRSYQWTPAGGISAKMAVSVRSRGGTFQVFGMSALGHKQTCAAQKGMSALPPIATAKADICGSRIAVPN